MDGYEYVRKAASGPIPKTPAAAFRAVLEGLLPAEAFVYRAASVKSLLDKPYGIEELERILAQENMDYGMVLLLAEILEDLLGDGDADVALFAAEGINTIEGRFNERVKLLQALIQIDADAEYLRRLAEVYWEIAGLQRKKPAIRNFYLREAFAQLRRIAGGKPETRRDGILMAKILLLLNIHDQAREVLHGLDPEQKDPEILLLAAEAEFLDRNVFKVAETLKRLEDLGSAAEGPSAELAAFWLQRPSESGKP